MPSGPQPHLWLSGPDPLRHRRYRAWQQQRNQALWRGETWHLSFEQWLEIWGEQIQQRGRRRQDLCLTRRDYELPWQLDNVEVVNRSQHHERQLRQGPTRHRRNQLEIARDRELGIIRPRGQRFPLEP